MKVLIVFRPEIRLCFLTTLTSYGSVPYERQAEIFRGFQTEVRSGGLDEDAYQMILDALQAVRR